MQTELKASNQLVAEYLEIAKARKLPRKALAPALDISEGRLSEWSNKPAIPLVKIPAFVKVLGLTQIQGLELLVSRLAELQECEEVKVDRATLGLVLELAAPDSEGQFVLDAYREELGLFNVAIFADPHYRDKLKQAFRGIATEILAEYQEADDALLGESA